MHPRIDLNSIEKLSLQNIYVPMVLVVLTLVDNTNIFIWFTYQSYTECPMT